MSNYTFDKQLHGKATNKISGVSSEKYFFYEIAKKYSENTLFYAAIKFLLYIPYKNFFIQLQIKFEEIFFGKKIFKFQ